VVGNHDIPDLVPQRSEENLSRLHPQAIRPIPGTLKLANDEIGVVIRVLDEQKP
jgi:hypothetical protein